ncbi:MAG: cupredoxin domain-containing protein [Bacteroidetes bacterium]|nr:cupredoxin domain-containing protein [Bacteroidota bacterium]
MAHTKDKLVAVFLGLLLINACTNPTSQTETALKNKTIDTVLIQNMVFTPDSISISTGSTVVFINKDMVDHTVTDQADTAHSSGILHSGSAYTLKVDKSFNYYCMIHPVMKGKLIVQ